MSVGNSLLKNIRLKIESKFKLKMTYPVLSFSSPISTLSFKSFTIFRPFDEFIKLIYRQFHYLVPCQGTIIRDEGILASISSTFYVRIFRTNVVLAAFFLVTCRLRVWRSYEKCTRIKLMKLTAGYLLALIQWLHLWYDKLYFNAWRYVPIFLFVVIFCIFFVREIAV